MKGHFTKDDLDFIKSLNGEYDEVNGYYFVLFNNEELHIDIYGAENGFYYVEVWDSCMEHRGRSSGESIKQALKMACESFCLDVRNVVEALDSIKILNKEIKQ